MGLGLSHLGSAIVFLVAGAFCRVLAAAQMDDKLDSRSRIIFSPGRRRSRKAQGGFLERILHDLHSRFLFGSGGFFLLEYSTLFSV